MKIRLDCDRLNPETRKVETPAGSIFECVDERQPVAGLYHVWRNKERKIRDRFTSVFCTIIEGQKMQKISWNFLNES